MKLRRDHWEQMFRYDRRILTFLPPDEVNA